MRKPSTTVYGSARSVGQWAVYSFEGDIHLLDTHSGNFRRITQTAEVETEPSFTRDERKIVFRRGDNYFLFREGEPLIQQLTDIRWQRS
jgi:Tol biopolymer transport system component